MPVGACWARAEVAAAFVPGDHGSTFGGQPLAMSAARATLAVMEAEDVPERAQAAGARLRAGLGACPGWSRAGRGTAGGRGAGQRVRRGGLCQALAEGLVINAPRPDVLRFAPSLLVSDAEIDRGGGHGRARILATAATAGAGGPS